MKILIIKLILLKILKIILKMYNNNIIINFYIYKHNKLLIYYNLFFV